MSREGRYHILYHHRIRAEDGQAMHVRELIGALREEGHEVVECALVRKADPPRHSEAEPASFWERVHMPRTAVEAMEIAYNHKGAQLLRRAVARRRPDFIYERHALHLHAGLTVAREHGIPLLLEVNSPMCDEMTRLGLLRFPRRARRVERRVLGGADRVFPVTRVLRDWLVRCGARAAACRVIGNAAVPGRYPPEVAAAGAAVRATHGIPADAFVLGFVGYMRDWHRLDFAVDALARPELAAVRLLLVGEGPALEQVLARAVARGVRDRVISVGAVAPSDVPRHVAAFDVGTIPAINPYSSPLKLFDYFVAGVTALAPDQPNVAEVVRDGHNGALFAADDGGAFADRLARLVADRASTRALGERGRTDLVEHDWTWRGNARRVVRAFEELEPRMAVTT